MSDEPKLAIIISCYNYEAFVERAIRSVLNQWRSDCELVVVDDGSTDRSWDVIRRSGVTAYRTANGSQRVACLYGLDRTTAPFVLFLDADDELKPAALAAIMDKLDHDVAKLQFSLERIDADGRRVIEAAPALEAFRRRDALARQVLRTGVYKSPPTSGNVFRRDVCELLREATYDRSADGITLFAAPFMGDVISLSEELGRYRIHDRNISGLGRSPDPALLENEIWRFVARLEHLRTILARLNPGQRLVSAQDTFYFRERSFCLSLARGRRPPLARLPALLVQLVVQDYSPRNKLAMATFFILGACLPRKRGQALLAYRFMVGRRSIEGLLDAIRGT